VRLRTSRDEQQVAISPLFDLKCLCTSSLFLIDATPLWSDELYSVGEGCTGFSWPETGVLDRSGLTLSLLMVVGVVLVSFVKPMAFSRYFVVLVPAVCFLFWRFSSVL